MSLSDCCSLMTTLCHVLFWWIFGRINLFQFKLPLFCYCVNLLCKWKLDSYFEKKTQISSTNFRLPHSICKVEIRNVFISLTRHWNKKSKKKLNCLCNKRHFLFLFLCVRTIWTFILIRYKYVLRLSFHTIAKWAILALKVLLICHDERLINLWTFSQKRPQLATNNWYFDLWYKAPFPNYLSFSNLPSTSFAQSTKDIT